MVYANYHLPRSSIGMRDDMYRNVLGDENVYAYSDESTDGREKKVKDIHKIKRMRIPSC